MGILQSLMENIFPERTDHKIIRLLGDDALLHLVQPSISNDFVSLLPFSEPSVRAAIHEAKFHANEKAWALLSSALEAYLKHCAAGTFIIPIPLSRRRERERGYNQITKILEQSLKEQPHLKLRANILFRARDTKPQTELKRKDRLNNLKNAFRATATEPLENLAVIIIDDVATTGATLKAAEAALKTLKPGSITLLALAH